MNCLTKFKLSSEFNLLTSGFRGNMWPLSCSLLTQYDILDFLAIARKSLKSTRFRKVFKIRIIEGNVSIVPHRVLICQFLKILFQELF